jgi:hypothetical protein
MVIEIPKDAAKEPFWGKEIKPPNYKEIQRRKKEREEYETKLRKKLDAWKNIPEKEMETMKADPDKNRPPKKPKQERAILWQGEKEKHQNDQRDPEG